MQTILGSSGTIGTDLARSLSSYTSSIRLVSRNPKKINDGDRLLPADLTDKNLVFKAIKDSEVVYLTVGLAYSLKIWEQTWPPLIKNVVDACIENNCKLVFFDNVYMIGGDNVKHITEQSPVSPVSKKGVIRATLNKIILDKVEKGKLNAIIARSADFYGPVGNTSILMELVYKNLSKNKKAQWFFNATTRHSFTYTPDAGKATAMLGNTSDAYNQIWNLPTATNSLTGQEWVELFAREMGKDKKFYKYQLLPAWAIGGLGLFVPFLKEIYEMRYQYDRDYFFDSSKFEKYFSYKPTSYVDGVREILKRTSH